MSTFWQGIQVGHIKKFDNRLRIDVYPSELLSVGPHCLPLGFSRINWSSGWSPGFNLERTAWIRRGSRSLSETRGSFSRGSLGSSCGERRGRKEGEDGNS